MLALSACGDDNNGDETTAGGANPAAELSGDPIRVLTYTSINSKGPTYPNIAETAKVFEKSVNASGGIQGHPLEVTICDDKGTPTGAAACARKAVAEDFVAAVGSFSFFGAAIQPVLRAGKVPSFGQCCPLTPEEWTDPNNYPTGDGQLYTVGMVKHAVESGCKHINAAIIDGAQANLPPMENAMKAYGREFGEVVILPPVAQDFSPQIAQATSGDADCIIMLATESQFVAWNPAYIQSGATARLYGPQGNIDAVSLKGVGDKLDGSIIGALFPDLSTPPFDDFRAALEKFDAPTEYDYNSAAGLGTWTGYTAMKVIMDEMEGPITAATFKAAVEKTDHLDTGGKTPIIDFTKPWTDYPELERLFNRSSVLGIVKDGKVVPLTTEFEDLSDLALGKKPS